MFARQRFVLSLFVPFIALAAGLCGTCAAGNAADESTANVGAEVAVSRGGRALMPVVVAPQASEPTRGAAAELADYLSRITGGEFSVVEGDGSEGIALGQVGELSLIGERVDFQPADPLRRDEFLMRTHGRGVQLVGASPLATQFAVWGLLHTAGYRLYFPTDTWEVVPQEPNLSFRLDRFERPDYVTRSAPRGAPWSDARLWQRWKDRNRVTASFQLSTGHAYDGIIRRNADVFATNPDFYALVDGERRLARQVDGRGNIKFCISNPQLRRVVVEDAVRQARARPEIDSVSMDPSDGGHWCECQRCAEVGSVSDRAILLANETAEAINALGLGDKYVGIYAYNQHSPPPQIRVHPKVIVSIATSFIRGGYTVEQLVEGWQAAGATIGVREYHDVFPWSHDQPRRARGGDLSYLQRTIPWFHSRGARFMNSENSDSWGANGLGYWITPQLLWDVSLADRVDTLVDDFCNRCFAGASQPMREFYHLVALDRSLRTPEDVIARLYRHLETAYSLSSGDAAVKARLDDLTLYVHFVELYHRYRDASGGERQRAFEQIWRHAYRMRDRMMLSTVAICSRDRFRDSAVRVPAEAAWSVPAPDNPWKDSAPFSAEEIRRMLSHGIANHREATFEFEPVEFSTDLVPARSLGLVSEARGQFNESQRGRMEVLTWLEPDARSIELVVRGGLIAHYRDRGNVHFELFADQEATLQPVAEDRSVPPDGETHRIRLASPYSGLHRLQWNDGHDRTEVHLPGGLPWTIRSTMDAPMNLSGRWTLYFYVPAGTAVVGGYASETTGRIVDSHGRTALEFAEMEGPGYFEVAVPSGTDGKLWKIEQATGVRNLMTVPPYLARSADELLLPREVVVND